MIDTDKYEGHTPADEWRLVFNEVNDCYNKEMLGLTVRAYHLGQMQACDYEDYLVAQANQDLARDAPLLLAEVKRLREQLTSADKMIREMIRESRDTPREAYVSGSAREAEQLFVHVLEANWDEVIE